LTLFNDMCADNTSGGLAPLRKGGRTEGGWPSSRPPLSKGGQGGSFALALASATRS
jgi:hypothetical protein